MNVSDRLTQAQACQVITLTESEKDLYTGAGLRLARFKDGVLVELWDPGSVPYKTDTQAMADTAVQRAVLWFDAIPEAERDVWCVMASGYELCDPFLVTTNDPASVARMARLVADEVVGMNDFGSEEDW